MKEEKLQLQPRNTKDHETTRKQIYANKQDHLKELDKLLETYNLPGVSQKEIEN